MGFNEDIDLNEFIPIAKKQLDPLTYEGNLSALESANPALTQFIKNVSMDEDILEIMPSESGVPRILFKRSDGESVYIHSATDPVVCATDAIELLGKIGKEGVIVLFGFGLGYFAEELLKRLERGHIIIIYEAMPQIFKAALMARDISELIKSEKVRIIIGEELDQNDTAVIHSVYNHIINGKFWVVRHEPSVSLNREAYELFLKRLNEEKNLADLGIGTIIHRGKEFMNATLANVPVFLNTPGVNKLKGLFKDRPFIIVSAGPSLDRNKHLLKRAKGKAVIIATGGTIPTLLPCDIIPDIVVEVDPLAANIENKLMDNPLLKKVALAALVQYTPQIMNMYPGPLFINGTVHNSAYQWLSSFWEEKGYVEGAGGSVAHLAFRLAEFMGAETIAIAGQDLSYSIGKFHCEGYTEELEEFEKNDMRRGHKTLSHAIPVRNIFNEDVYTIKSFLGFKTAFERMIREFPGTVFNVTEGGLRIEGAADIRLSDFIDEYCADIKGIDICSKLSSDSFGGGQYNIDGLLNTVTFAKDKLDEIRKTSKQILKYIEKLEKLKANDRKETPEFHNILKKVEQLIGKIKHPLLNLIAAYQYSLELYMRKQDNVDIDEIEDAWERVFLQLERGQKFYSELGNAIKLFNEQLNKLIDSLSKEKNVLKVLGNETVREDEKLYNAALLYKKAGLISQAVKYMELVATNSRDQQNPKPDTRNLTPVFVSLAELYLQQFRFYEAKEVLTGIRDQVSGVSKKGKGKDQSDKIKELLQECDKKITAWENRKKEMKKLLEDAERSYGGHLESGYFYFRLKDYERAEKAYLKAISGQVSGIRYQEGKDRDQESGVRDQQSPIPDTRNLKPEIRNLSAAYYGLAHVYIAKEDGEKAVEAFEKAIEADPENPLPYRDLGMMAYQNNNIESAELFFTRAIELAPQALELYKLLCDLYVGQSEVQKAISLYEDALLANPDNPVIQQELVTLYQLLISRTGTA